MPSKDYLLVGVTGGIGSGKSMVCGEFRELGRSVLNADDIARKILDTDERVKRRVQETFGPGAYLVGGELDRKNMAAMVFANPRLRKKLNAIVHPEVFRAIEEMTRALPPGQRKPYLIVEAALIYESGYDRTLDCVVVVDAPEETRIARIMQRDSCSREDVLRRIRSQMSARVKAARADFLIVNDRNTTELAAKVRFVDGLLNLMSPSISAS